MIQQATTKPPPIGSLDSVTNPGTNVLTAAGWAADPDAPRSPERVDLYVSGPGGTRGYSVTTSGSRPDVAAAFPWAGGSTGFGAVIQTQGAGTNRICAYAIDVRPPSTNPLLGCRSVQVRNAFGFLDRTGTHPNQIVSVGWALNPNNPGEHVEIHVYDTGPSGTRGYPGFRAAASRPDVAAAYAGYGADHGFRAVIPPVELGTHSVCTFAITTGGGAGNTLLGCTRIQVSNAFGTLDTVTARRGHIAATGWALNPNSRLEHVQIHVYDTSASGTRGYPGFYAGGSRPDVAAAYPGYGPAHGYLVDIPSVQPGQHRVCTYAITTGGGIGNTLLGCQTVVVPA